MNTDNQNSPTLTSQSWIVDNIKSLISNHEEDLNTSHNNSDSSLNNNDVTLTDDKLIDRIDSKKQVDSKLKDSSSSYFDINHDLSCDVEIEQSRTYAEYDNGVDRLPKRPFSPEEISENNNINNLLQNLGQYHHLNNFDFDTYSSNLFDFTNANNLLHSPNKHLQLNDFNELIYQPIQNQNAASSSIDSSIKKKKLTRTSTTSMILPLPTFSFTQPTLNDQPDSNLNGAAFESFNHNFIQQFNNDDSNYHSNPQSPTSNSSYLSNHYNSYLMASSMNSNHKPSSSNNNNRRSSLNAITNYPNEYENQIDTNTSTPFNQKLLINNSINKSASCCFHETAANDSDNYYSYDCYSRENSFYNNSMYYPNNNEPYRNNNNNNNMLKPFKNNENLDDSINILSNKNKYNNSDSSSNYNKRITKSSSNLFNNNNNHISNSKLNKNEFIHSASYDNIGLLNLSNSNSNNKSMNSSFTNYEINKHISNNNTNNNINNNYEKHHSNLVPFFPQDHPSQTDYNNKWAITPNHSSNIKQNNTNNNNCGNNSNKFQHNNHPHSARRGSSSSGSSSTNKSASTFQYDTSNNNDQIVLHVRNLDYKISSDEWKRILLENFRKHCKENLSINVVTNPDKSLLGVVKLASKEDAKLAISCLHHKKIGYKRLNVNIAYSSNTNSPKSKIVALLKASDSNEMALTRFIELYEQRYNQSITLSELFKLKEIVHISQSKDGQGRQIKLISKNYQHNLENEMQELLHTPYCSLHSHQKIDREKDSSVNINLLSPNNATGGCKLIGWLPNVIVSLRAFKSAVHKLLNDHGGQMPLLSFLDCYKCCIFNDSNTNSNNRSNNSNCNLSKNNKSENGSQENNNQEISTSYQLIIDNENGVSLEHLITCAQDVQIQMNEGYYKQLQWENDKSKPTCGRGLVKNQSSNNLSAAAVLTPKVDDTNDSFDDPVEESQRKINQFSHEVVELLKVAPRCIIPLSKFNNEYHKKYGKQCRVADYGYTKLIELLESIPHILQMLDGEFEKKLTLTHRVQVKRFGNDLAKVLKSHSTKQMFADEYPVAYEKHFVKQFDIRDYGVCYLEDMLAELPESTLCRKEIEGRTFIQIPKIIQMDEERLCTYRLSFDIIDMLKHKPRFSIQFNKFIPNFHHHFGRQLKLSKYGFSKLIELLESMPETVHVIVKDALQFVQLSKEIMIDLITQNFVKLLEESPNFTINISLVQLEELYTAKFQPIYYDDFECDNFSQFFSLLLFDKYGLRTILSSSLPNEIEYMHYYKNLNHLNVDKKSDSFVNVNENLEWTIRLEKLNERELKKFCKLILKKLMENQDEILIKKIDDFQSVQRAFCFKDFLDLMLTNCVDLTVYAKSLNKRAFYYMIKQLSDFFVIKSNEKFDNSIIDIAIQGLSEMYVFAKQIRNLYKSANLLDMTISDLELAYKQAYKNNSNTHDKIDKDGSGNIISVFPCKRLGFIDVDMLFSQGLSLVVTIKKYNDKSICLNKEFWPVSLTDTNNTNLSDSFNSPSSSSPGMRQQTTTSNSNNQTNGTPSLHRMTMQSSTSSSSSAASSYSRRNINLNE